MKEIRQISVADALEAFDRWDPVARRAGGPAYGRVVLYAAGEIELKELARAVLLDRGIDPERWESVAGVVAEAFEVWMQLEVPVCSCHRGAA